MIRVLLIMALLFATSCSTKAKEANKKFVKRYGGQVDKLRDQREAFLRSGREQPRKIGWKDPAEDLGIAGANRLKTASIDTSKITLPPPPEPFQPDMQTLLRSKSGDRLPDDIFEVSYNLENYPESYKEPGISFDDIRVPDRDAFGVTTDLGDKEYILVGQRALQSNVDYLNSASSRMDKEIGTILVSEKKEIRRKKKLGIVVTRKDYEKIIEKKYQDFEDRYAQKKDEEEKMEINQLVEKDSKESKEGEVIDEDLAENGKDEPKKRKIRLLK